MESSQERLQPLPVFGDRLSSLALHLRKKKMAPFLGPRFKRLLLVGKVRKGDAWEFYAECRRE
jgi:hypothetical protein